MRLFTLMLVVAFSSILTFEHWAINHAVNYSLISHLGNYPISTESGRFLGFILAIVGSVLLLFSVSYSLFKRIEAFAFLGEKIKSLELHILTGALGAVLILYHTNFHFRGIASVAFYALVIVTITGIVGDIISTRFNKKFLFYWDFLHVAFIILFVASALLHIITALIFHKGMW